MKNKQITIKQALFYSVISMTGLFTGIAPVKAASTDLADVPMAVNSLAKPNIMFMLDDSGSMSHIVPDSPYVATTTYLASCPGGNTLSGGQTTSALAISVPASDYDIRITNATGDVQIKDSGGTSYTYGTGSGQKCFNPGLYYLARLNANNSGTTNTPTGYLATVYTGNYLNWYFGAPAGYSSAANFGANSTQKSGTLSRMQATRSGAKAVLDTLDRVRVGLFSFNGETGGTLHEVMGDLDSAKLTAIKTKIDSLTADGYTPLAETLADIGSYFVTGYTGNLKLHPYLSDNSINPSAFNRTVAQVFPHTYNNNSGVGTPPNPIQYYCQKTFTVLMTDGRATRDITNIGTDLLDYDGDCSGSNSSNCTTNDKKLSSVIRSDGLVYSYESSDGSDYLDDVAQALYEIDLRPDLTKPTTPVTTPPTAAIKNNIATYTIGFSDLQLLTDPLLKDTAAQAGGQFFTADSTAGLTAAFQVAIDDILGKDGSAAAVAVANANVTSGDNASYVSSYNSGTWTGDLIAYPINLTTGVPDITAPIWNTGCASPTALVDSADASKGVKGCSTQVKLDAITAASRKIVTLKDESSTRTPVQFQPAAAATTTKLSTTQQTSLNSTTTPPGLTDGANVVNYLRGDRSLENTSYRGRTHVQGDMINSEPTVQREPFFSYADGCYSVAVTTGPGSSQCTTPFKTAKASRTRMVYIGGNDGMLHAFNASSGVEEWAYVPRFTMSNLNNLSKKSGFSHKYTVDGTAVIGDVDFGNTAGGSGQDWRTILVGGLGKGGRGFYALDVTCPVGDTTTATATACATTGLTEANLTSKVLWEFPSSDSSHTASPASISPKTHLQNVGHSFGKPIITKTAKYGWVVLVTSGYNNGDSTSGTDYSGGNGRGYLYVLDAKTGALLNFVDTGAGTATSPSGLTHIAAYAANSDIDNTTEFVYGGDLLGNVWRFDLRDNSGAIVYTATTVAVLKDGSSNLQPITSAPELANISIGGVDKRFVYVGTGKYLGTTDVVATPTTQTMYGLIDDITVTTSPVIPSTTRSNLQEQTFISSATTRSITTVTPNFSVVKGWYIDMPISGERIVSDPAIALGTLVFTSIIPSNVTCVPGGSSWLNRIDYQTGGKLTGTTVAHSSSKLGDALASRPVLIKLPDGSVKVLTRLSDATTVSTGLGNAGGGTGTTRISWREIIEQ